MIVLRLLIVPALVLLCIFGLVESTVAQGLPGRLITFKKVFDGWWDVACDTAPDGSDARCYVQYVDPYSLPPRFRAAMVDFLYRKAGTGGGEPVITFDVEPDLTFQDDVELWIMTAGGTPTAIARDGCVRSKCVFSGPAARDLLKSLSQADTLVLKISERSGKVVERRWPLGNMAEIVKTLAAERQRRNLP